jgi:uncharacterized membrane protein HdeD (DUF308 family)
MGKRRLSIWFFVGLLLFIYGILILGAGLWAFVSPPAQTVVLAELHAAIWWGALLLVAGVLYLWFFSPRRERKKQE